MCQLASGSPGSNRQIAKPSGSIEREKIVPALNSLNIFKPRKSVRCECVNCANLRVDEAGILI